jgi:cytoskeletal protein CcmA (bactofilin family)
MKTAQISGELVADVHAFGTVRLNHSARMFGNIQAANLVVEPGAVFVGAARIGKAPEADSHGHKIKR